MNKDRGASPDTLKQYARVAQNLLSRFEQETGLSIMDKPADLIDWLHAALETVAPSTRRHYIASLKSYDPIDLSFLHPIFKRTDWPNKKDIIEQYGRRTAGNRAKRLPTQNLEIIIEAFKANLQRYNSDRWATLVAILIGGKSFGLRPKEWLHAQIETDIPEEKTKEGFIGAIRAKTLKTNLHSLFDERTLWVRESHSHPFKTAQWLIEHCSTWDEEDYQKEIRKMGALLRNFQKRNPEVSIKGKFITLYSGRHQFASDAKSHGLSNATIAALLGHSSYHKQEIYGKKIFGKRGRSNRPFHVEPDPAQVEAIMAHVEERANDPNRATDFLKEAAKGKADWIKEMSKDGFEVL